MTQHQPLTAATPPAEQPVELMAVVDLGSNSFQMTVASFSHGQLRVVDRLREMVRLAAGLDAKNNLDKASQVRALECLARFGERLRDIPSDRLRIVGTNTLRKARDPAAFIRKAEQLLGHEIDIISGIEEARLIYIGVSRSLPVVSGGQLVIDIGGGSTELAVGEGYQSQKLASLHMGCVELSRQYFADGKLTAKAFALARTAVQLELRPLAEQFRSLSWVRAAGASGTIRAAASVVTEMGLSNSAITVPALERVIDEMVRQGHVDDLTLPGLTEERAPVFPGGIAILLETMRQLQITSLITSQGALREGVLYDLVGRLGDEDARELTVRAMQSRYHVDTQQATRVEATALAMLAQVAETWKLDTQSARRLLGWAARMHEIGLDIAHSHYHHHGAYLLEHADMPGFNRTEQQLLSCLVGAHRRKFVNTDFASKAPKGWGKRSVRLAIILRLAVLFNRSRTDEFPAQLKIRANRRKIKLGLSRGWLEANPLTLADLQYEQDSLDDADYELKLVAADDLTG